MYRDRGWQVLVLGGAKLAMMVLGGAWIAVARFGPQVGQGLVVLWARGSRACGCGDLR